MKFRAVLTAATSALFLALSSSLAAADTDDEREKLVEQQEQNEREIEELQSSLEGIDVDLQEAYLSLEQTRNQIPIAQEELATAQSNLSAAQRRSETIAGQLEAAQAELDTIETQLAEDSELSEQTQASLNELARSAYRGETNGSTVDLWLSSSSTTDLFSAMAATNSIARTESALILEAQTQVAVNENRLARQQVVESDIIELQAEADAIVIELDQTRAVAQTKTDELIALEADEAEHAAELEDRREEFSASAAKLESDNKDIAATILAIDEENRRQAEIAAEEARQQEADRLAREQAAEEARQNVAPVPSATQEAAPAQTQEAAPEPEPTQAPVAVSTTFIPPVPAPVYVTSPFGMRWYPITGGNWMHNGVDLRSVCGEGQVATAAGVVAEVRPAAGNGTHGNQVIINHGTINGSSYVSVYNHLSGFAVSPGQSVSQGQVIGYTGQTGQVTGCHVHFEIWQNGSVIDPMTQPGFTRRN